MFEKMLERLIINFNLAQRTDIPFDLPTELDPNITLDDIIRCIFYFMKALNSPKAKAVADHINMYNGISFIPTKILPITTIIAKNLEDDNEPMLLLDTRQKNHLGVGSEGVVTRLCRIDTFPFELYAMKSPNIEAPKDNYIWDIQVCKQLGDDSLLVKYSYAQLDTGYCLFSKRALCDLQSMKTKELSRKHKNNIAMQLLQQVEYAHRYGVILQDIKTSNILVYYNGINYTVKITDFGLAYIPGSKNNNAICSLLFESPEINYSYKFKDKLPKSLLYLHEHFHENPKLKSYADLLLNYTKDIEDKIKALGDSIHTPNKSNDLFSLGIVLYYVYFYGIPRNIMPRQITQEKILNNIKSSSIIKGLLCPYREERMSPGKAMEILQTPSTPQYRASRPTL